MGNLNVRNCSRKDHIRNKRPKCRHVEEKNLHLKVFQISPMNSDDDKLSVVGYLNKIYCRMIIDSGANITIHRTDVA